MAWTSTQEHAHDVEDVGAVGETKLTGKVISYLAPATNADLRSWGWSTADAVGRPAVLVLEGSTRLIASCDPEGNRPGAVFGYDDEGDFAVPVFTEASPSGALIEGITGVRVAAVRQMSDDEMARFAWSWTRPVVLELEGGTVLIPSHDSEGNGPGAFVVVNGDRVKEEVGS